MSNVAILHKPLESDDPIRLLSPLDMPITTFNQGLDRRKTNRQTILLWIKDNLVEGVDFGIIPTKKGTPKKSLFKSGAERICVLLGVSQSYPAFSDYEQAALHNQPFEQIIIRCELLLNGVEEANTAHSELITTQDVQHIESLLTEHSVDRTRFLNFLKKLCESKNFPVLTEIPQLPMPLLATILEKIPTTFANTALSCSVPLIKAKNACQSNSHHFRLMRISPVGSLSSLKMTVNLFLLLKQLNLMLNSKEFYS